MAIIIVIIIMTQIIEYWHRRTGAKGVMPFPSGVQRKVEARPLIRVSALYYLSCFDADGWFRDWKNVL